MSSLSLSEESRRYNYLVLTTKVVQVLQAANRGDRLSEIQVNILNRGESLLSGIIEGSVFAEGKNGKSGFQPPTPTQKEITIYGYALATVNRLEVKGKNDILETSYFLNLLETLKQLEKKKSIDDLDLSKPKEFFQIFGNALREDIHKERNIAGADIFLSS